jgi:succinate dehydrogenase / fumarate reductase cytochrome b subunit
MSSIAVGSPKIRAFRFHETGVFKKAVMATTGLVLLSFVIGHLIGNLQVYEGAQKLDDYGKLLRSMPALLWSVRIILLICVTLHIITTIQLYKMKSAARPVGYVKKDNSHSSYASRTMYWSGPVIAAFVIYHILHLTLGVVQSDIYVEGAVYNNTVHGFQNPLISGFYIIAMVLLCMHLYHGVWSMFQSLGANHPRYSPMLRKFAAFLAIAIAAGNISIPVSVMLGLIQ